MTKKNSLSTLAVAAIIALSTNVAIATDCGNVKTGDVTKTISVNSDISSQLDAKVEGCPQGYDWNACCNI